MDLGSLIAAVLLSIGMIGADAALNAGTIAFNVDVTEELGKSGYNRVLVDSLLDNSFKRLVSVDSYVHPPTIRSSEEKSIVGSIAESMNLKDVTAAFQAELGLNPVRLTGTLMSGNPGGKQCGVALVDAFSGVPTSHEAPVSPASVFDTKAAEHAVGAGTMSPGAMSAGTMSAGAMSSGTMAENKMAAMPAPAAAAGAPVAAGHPVPAALATPSPEKSGKEAVDGDRLRFILSGRSVHTGNFVIDCTSSAGQPLPAFMRIVAIEIIKRIEPYAAGIAMFNEMHRQHAFMVNSTPYVMFKSFIETRLTSEVGSEDSNVDYSAFRNLLGMAALMTGRHEEAEKEFLLANEADPELGYPMLNLAFQYIGEKRFDDALKILKTAKASVTIRKANFLMANAQTLEGLALWGKNDLQGASDAFQNAAKSFPDTFFAYYYWSKLLASVGNDKAAEELAHRASTNIFGFETYPESMLLYFVARPDKDFNLVHINFATARTARDLDAQAMAPPM